MRVGGYECVCVGGGGGEHRIYLWRLDARDAFNLMSGRERERARVKNSSLNPSIPAKRTDA